MHTAAWSPNGARIASASNDTTVQGWDARTGTPIFTCNHTSTVNAVAWSPDGKRIASASGNIFFGSGFGVQVWDAFTGVHIFTYRGHKAPVSTLAWSPDGKRIASASASLEKTVQVCWLLRASVQNAKSWQDDFSLFYKP